MTHSVLTVLTMSKALAGKQSLSCGDISALASTTEHDRSNSKQRRISLRHEDCLLHRFMRPKSPLIHSMERGAKKRTPRPASTPLDLDDIDQRLIQIRGQLSMFREQDMEFRERLDSLSNSIDELASRSSLASSEVSDVTMPSDDAAEEHDYKDNFEDDDQAIENDFKRLSMSLSTEVLNSIPSITVTCYKICRQSSDPSVHETMKLLQLSDNTSPATQWQLPQRTYSTDQLYL